MIGLESSGSFDKTEKALLKLSKDDIFAALHIQGSIGVAALSKATPKDSGETANSWYYKAEKKRGTYYLTWYNRNIAGGTPIAIMLQYGHGTGTGGYVAGRDFINPAMRPIFDKIVADVWKAVKSA